jgi:hypothetical protein
MKSAFKYLALILFAALLMFRNAPITNAQDDTDYKAYSLFVYNFIKYIEWPTIDDEFVIGVMGDSPAVKEIENMAKLKKAKGKQIILKKITTADEALKCLLVYICNSKSSQLKSVVEKTKGSAVLTVAEREGLARKGACMSFITMDDDVLKFEINKSAIEGNKLKIPSALSNLGLPI